MSFLEIYAVGLGAVVAYITAIWLVSVRLRDASIVDIFWGPGFALVAGLYALLADGYAARQLLIVCLVSIWGLRLGLHVASRNWGHGEDPRYRAWREETGDSFWWVSFFRVYLLQGAILWIVSAPLLAAQRGGPEHFTPLDVAGGAVWAAGFLFEAIGDYQLARFKRDSRNRGRVMRRGLWAYTRHPNYFGDATLWWGFFVIAAATPNGYWTFFGPLLMTFLLVRVSGVSLLERRQRATKPEYADYIASTSAFFPWPPRRRPPEAI